MWNVCWVSLLWQWHRAPYGAAEWSDVGGRVCLFWQWSLKRVLYETLSAVFECLRSYKIFLSQWSFAFGLCRFAFSVLGFRIVAFIPVAFSGCARALNLRLRCRWNTPLLNDTWGEHPPHSSLPSGCFWSLSWFIVRKGCVWLLGGAFKSTLSFHMKTRWSNF